MSLQFRAAHLPALFLSCALLPASTIAQTVFQTHTIVQNPLTVGSRAHGDFTGDGREDLVVDSYTSSNAPITQLYPSNQDGTYGAPITLPFYVQVVGDFNHDGKLDFASHLSNTNGIVVYLGNGDGTFQSPKTIADGEPGDISLVAADMNNDGKTDLVEVGALATANGPVNYIQVWISNGDGTFTKGQTTYPLNQQTVQLNQALIGDFDGDGKTDLALMFSAEGPTTIQVWYGDGTGNLSSPYTVNDPNEYSEIGTIAADINNDGKSDLISAANVPNGRTNTYYPLFAVFEGNANRTLSYRTIATTQCPLSAAVADFNGDGLNDLAYGEGACDTIVPQNFVLKPATAGGGFGAEQTLYQAPANGYTGLPYVVRTTTGSKPDILFNVTTTSGSLVLLSNESTGAFPSCGVTGKAEGITICSPGATSSSPVKFSAAAAGPTPMRTVAVWADGKKVAEQKTHAFSNYSFVDSSVALAAGSHAITINGIGWDDTHQTKSFTLTVSGTCSAPSAAGVNVCSPVNGSSVSSPVQINAAATVSGGVYRFELWSGSTKLLSVSNSGIMNQSLSLAAGSYHLVFDARNSSGVHEYATRDITVK